MAKTPISLEQLENASEDVEALGLAVNGDDTTTVTTRLNRTYPTLAKAIKEIFERGGLPATPFKTKALMTASALVDGKYAMVTDDTVNNGLYVKTAGTWVKSGYDPLTCYRDWETDRKSTRLNSSHSGESRMPSSA